MELYQRLPPEALKIVLLLFLSFLVGLAWEEYKVAVGSYSFGGVRTFPLIGLIGYSIALLSGTQLRPLTIEFLVVAGFLLLSYWHKLSSAEAAGITSEMSGLTTFLAGALVCYDHLRNSRPHQIAACDPKALRQASRFTLLDDEPAIAEDLGKNWQHLPPDADVPEMSCSVDQVSRLERESMGLDCFADSCRQASKLLGGFEMTRSKLPRMNARREPVMMAGIPVNRFHSFERMFFKEDIPVLQGITFPLKKTSFESGKIRLDKGAKVLGAAGYRVDARTVSYAAE